jgi:hypothetical protein
MRELYGEIANNTSERKLYIERKLERKRKLVN